MLLCRKRMKGWVLEVCGFWRDRGKKGVSEGRRRRESRKGGFKEKERRGGEEGREVIEDIYFCSELLCLNGIVVKSQRDSWKYLEK